MSLPKYIGLGSETQKYMIQKRVDPEFEMFVKGALVWIPHDEHVFVPGKVKVGFEKGSDEGVVNVIENGKIKEVDISEENSHKVVHMGLANLNCVSHLSNEMPDLSEPALLHNMRLRFQLGYSFMKISDSILVFLNDRYETDILTLSQLRDEERGKNGKKKKKVKKKKKKKKQPEAEDDLEGGKIPAGPCDENFQDSVAKSFDRLVLSQGKESQSIIVTGAKGSGKRDVTRYVLLRAIQLSRPNNADWWKKLLSADTILQSFGDDNGFVRWTELQLVFPKQKNSWFGRKSRDATQIPRPKLLGSVLHAFGLDQTRVTDSTYDMFPIFYSLVAAANLLEGEEGQMLRDKFEIGNQKNYKTMQRESHQKLPPGHRQRMTCRENGCRVEAYGHLHYCLDHINTTSSATKKKCKEKECNEKEVGDFYCWEHGPKGLSQGSVNPVAAARGWKQIIDAIKTLNIPDAQLDDMIRILSGILIIGNIAFKNIKVEENEQASLEVEGDDDDGLDPQMEVLGVKLKDLKASFRIKTLRVRDETYRKERPLAEKYTVRDGLARAVYSFLFKWIVLKVNREVSRIDDIVKKHLKEEQQQSSSQSQGEPNGKKKHKGQVGIIGVLENTALEMKTSSLEDLYQNYRLEKFHSYFSNNLIVNNAKKVFATEGLQVNIPPGNGECLSLLMNSVHTKSNNAAGNGKAPSSMFGRRKSAARLGKSSNNNNNSSQKPGVLQMVEEEIRQPGGTDKSLARKILKTQKGNRFLVNQSLGEMEFTIVHFGGPITYNIDGFLDRARSNTIPEEVLNLLKDHSSIPLIRNILTISEDDTSSDSLGGGDFDSDLARPVAASALEKRKSAHMAEKNADLVGNEEHRRGTAETAARRINHEMEKAIYILNQTNAQFMVCIGSNPDGERSSDETINSKYLISQMREIGLVDAVCNRLYHSIRGQGIPPWTFIQRYGPIHKNFQVFARGNQKMIEKNFVPFCEALSNDGLLIGQWEIGRKTQHIFINPESYFGLEAALKLVQTDTTIYIQRFGRSYLAKLERIRRMHRKIKNCLDVAIENSKKDDLLKWVKEAEKWKLKHKLVSIANTRLLRIEKEDDILQQLDEAYKKDEVRGLYKLLGLAEKAGMTGMEFPIVAKCLQKLKSLENTVVTKKDKEELERRFQDVANELATRNIDDDDDKKKINNEDDDDASSDGSYETEEEYILP